MMRQVIIFFTVMLLMLIVNFVLELVFYYYMISPVNVKSQKRVIEQEKLISNCSYIHSSVEILFNFVLIAFLIAQYIE